MELLRLLLNRSFYEGNKYKILPEMFPASLTNLINIIITAQEKYKRDLSLTEIKALYKVNYPTAPIKHLEEIYRILDTLPEIQDDIAQEVLEKAWINEIGRQITQIGADIVNGKGAVLEKAKALISKIEQGEFSSRDDIESVSSELEDILAAVSTTTKWPFFLDRLHKVCGGLGPGIFAIIAGRVESGKTCLSVSMAADPNGFAANGALVHYYGNEESAMRTQARAFMCYTGMPLHQLDINREEAKAQYTKIKDNLKFFECRDRSLAELNAHIEKYKPDIVIIDQMDKISIPGSFAREDERLGALYSEFRNILGRRNTGGIAVTQLNAEAEGKAYISSANLSNARTAKAAECDIGLGIGKSPLHTDEVRIINPFKSKITGLHEDVVCIIRPEISRYTV